MTSSYQEGRKPLFYFWLWYHSRVMRVEPSFVFAFKKKPSITGIEVFKDVISQEYHGINHRDSHMGVSALSKSSSGPVMRPI